MTLWKLTAREVRRRPGRAAITLLSIAIGIGAVVAVSLGTATTREAYRRMYEEVGGRAALQITAEAGGTFPVELADVVQKVPGVAAAVPSMQRRTLLYAGQKQFDLLMMGIDPAGDTKVRDYELREGRFLEGRDERAAVLEIGFAQGAGIRVGDEVLVRTLLRTRPRRPVTVVGLVAPRGAAGFNKGGVVLLPLGLAERWYSRAGQANTLDIALEPGAEEETVAQQVKAVVGPGLEVHPAAARTQLAKGTALIIEQGMKLASYFAVALASVIIINTFLMNVSERRRQLAVLRAVGATRVQVVRMLLGEGLAMGLLGTAAGCLVGAGGGYLLMWAITRMNVGTPPPIVFGPQAFLLAAVLGPAMALLSALFPALRTVQISPLEAMQPLVSKNGHRIPRWLTCVGVVLVVASSSVMFACVRGWVPAPYYILTLVVWVASFVLLIPWAVPPLGRAAAWVLRPVLRLEGQLAHRQIRRRPVRTGLTAGVLYLAMAVGIGLGMNILNIVGEVRAWHRAIVVGDFFLRGSFPDMATGEAVLLPKELGDEIRAIPGVATLDTLRFFHVPVGQERAFVVAQDFNGQDLPLNLYQANPAEVRRKLQEGDVVLGTVLAKSEGIRPGDEIELETKEGPKRVRVAALVVDYMVGGKILAMQRSLAEKWFHVEGASAFAITAQPESRTAVETALKEIAGDQGLLLHSFAELSTQLDNIVAGVVGCLWGVLVLGFVVAAFGIANTLAMNVLEQTRELALLRVVAMTRAQVRKMVLSQAGLIGLTGLLLGTFAGIGAAKFISMGTMPLLGYPGAFSLRPMLLVACFALAMIKVLLVARVPAGRAAKMDLLIALQHE